MNYLIFHENTEGEILTSYDIFAGEATEVAAQMQEASPFAREMPGHSYRRGVLGEVGGELEAARLPSTFMAELERLGRAKRVRYLTRVFVYGTLMKGQRNHDWHCRDALSVTKACALGELYDLGPFPAVRLLDDQKEPDRGCRDLAADVQLEARFSQSLDGPDLELYLGRPIQEGELVHGEVLELDGLDALAGIDRLEGVNYQTGAGLYERALVPVQLESGKIVGAWIYHMRDARTRGRRIKAGYWTA